MPRRSRLPRQPLSPAAERAALDRMVAAHRTWLKYFDRRVRRLRTPDAIPEETARA